MIGARELGTGCRGLNFDEIMVRLRQTDIQPDELLKVLAERRPKTPSHISSFELVATFRQLFELLGGMPKGPRT